jgi:uncharacterized protein YkwD
MVAKTPPNTTVQIILAIAVGIFVIYSAGLINEKLNEKPFAETGAAVMQGKLLEQAYTSNDCTVSSSDLSLSTEEQKLLPLINEYRAQNSLAAVQISPTLQKAASWKARDMHTNNYLSHTDSLGRGWYQITADCGYPYATEVNVAEIAASGYSTASSVLSAWKASPAHNAMLLWPGFRAAGIGQVGSYWSVMFAEKLDSAPTNDTIAPTVIITSPINGADVSGNVDISVSAIDNVAVTKVEFYVDDILKSSDSASPYIYTWDTTTASNGNHTLSALAYDAATNVGISSDVNVIVSNGGLPSTPYGNITGTVTGSLGGVLSGVKVTTTLTGTKKTLSSTTNSAGVYKFTNIPPGTYILKYQAKGFIAQSATVFVTTGATTVKNVVITKR